VDPALLAVTLLAALAAMLGLWLLSLARRDASIVDVWWGPGFAWIAGVALLLAPEGPGARGVLAAGLAALWGARLGGYLLWRSWGTGEDYRYRAMRRRHGERFGRVSLVTVFGLQGLLQWLVSLPLQVAILARQQPPLGFLDVLGAGLVGLGLVFEAVGDAQLARFKRDPAHAGQVMDRGLWRYSRHPNYFGDCLVWWGLYAVACGAPGGWLSLPAPALKTWLLLRVSGVRLLERSLVKRKPGYADYAARTSAFVPWPPRG
jgi:steroid 5-alpha reductase family enzyme